MTFFDYQLDAITTIPCIDCDRPAHPHGFCTDCARDYLAESLTGATPPAGA